MSNFQKVNKFYEQRHIINKEMSFERVQLQDLLQIMEIICSNVGYSRLIEEEMLVDYRTYFDICNYIFEELRIKIYKVQENKKLAAGQKLQDLIDLLSQELELDDFDISGEEIVNFNTEHIHRFLEILYEYSKIYMDSKKTTNVVKSAPNKVLKENDHHALHRSSAREPRRVDHEDEDEDEEEEEQAEDNTAPQQKPRPQEEVENYLIQQKTEKRKANYSAPAKRARSQAQTKKNLHLQVVHKIMGEKTKMLRAASRDNRKGRLQSIKQAKNSYKIFLKRYTKENIAASGKKKALKQKSTAKPISQQLPQKDFQIIDNFFESFSYKFRDKKAAYLRRIQKLARQQQLDRFCHQNKLDREMKKYMNERLQAELESETHQHRVRSQVLREGSRALDQNTAAVKKDIKSRDRQLKKEMKAGKIDQLRKIEGVMREHNEKVLMELEEGGRLEQIIMQMYKRF